MKGKTRKLLSTLLTLAMVFSIFAVMPITASAAGDTATWTDSTEAVISSWTDTGNVITISGTPSGNLDVPATAGLEVTITGTVTNSPNPIYINIGAGAKVIWKADFSSVYGAGVSISKSGLGAFEVAGGSITNNASNNAFGALTASGPVTISGGTVENTSTNGSSFAIYSGRVTVSGGTVKANGGMGVYYNAAGLGIEVTGGTVESAGTGTHGAISVAYTDVTVSGGTVKNTDDGPAIYSSVSGAITISGTAQVTAVDGIAINATGGTNSIMISDTAQVSATGTGTAIKFFGTINLAGGTVTANTGTAIDAGEIEVTGSATVGNSSSTNPAIAVGEGGLYTEIAAVDLTVKGGVTVTGDDCDIWATGGKITINGDVVLNGDNNYVGASYSGVLTIIGDVEFTGTNEKIIYAANGGKTYITGAITGGPDIEVGGAGFTTPTDTGVMLPSPYQGYYWDEYTDGTSYVYLRQGVITGSSATYIDLSETWFGTVDNDDYTTWDYDVDTNTINVYDDVNIISSTLVTGIDKLTIANGANTVTWTADYSGSVADSLVSVTGAGEFIMNSGSIDQSGTLSALWGADFTINGGTIKAIFGAAIQCANVTINNGTIENNSSANPTILGTGATVISGGIVKNTNSGAAGAINGSNSVIVGGSAQVSAAGTVNTINIIASSSNITISGTAQVSATGTGTAISCPAGTVTLAGGTVTANGTAMAANEIEVTGTATVGNSSSTNPAISANDLYTSAAAGNLTVNGNVMVAASSYADANSGGRITINGNVTLANDAGVGSDYGGTMTVNGDVSSAGASGRIYASEGGKTYITGTISTNTEIKADGTDFTSDFAANGLTYNGYYWNVYTNPDEISPSSYVYHRQGEIPSGPLPAIAVTATGLGSLKVGVPITTATILYTLTDGEYVVSPTLANFTVSGLPAGLTAGTAVRTSDTVITVPITGTPTAANASSVTLTYAASIPMANVTGATADISPTGTVTAGAVDKGTLVVTDLICTIPTTDSYTGLDQGIGSVTGPTGMGTVSVLYNGSTTAPTNAGTYTVTANVAEGTNYAAATGFSLGNYTIGKASLSLSGGTVTAKTYDGTASATITAVTFTGLQNSETLAIGTDYTVSGASYNSSDAGTTHTVTATVTLTATAKAANYTLTSGSLSIASQTISAADYTYTVAGTQSVPVGSGLSAITVAPANGTGVGGETVAGTISWYSNSARTTPAVDTDLSDLTVGETVTLYWSFAATDTNYSTAAKTGSTIFTIVDGALQTITFPTVTGGAVSKTYGDANFTHAATLSVGVGAVSYASSDPTVADVNASTGEVTIVKVGTTTITATAAAVPGTWAEASVSYTLTVGQKTVTVTAGTYSLTKVFDGATTAGTPSGGLLSVTGILAADSTVSVTPGTLPVYPNINVQSGTMLALPISLTGIGSANYTLASASVNVPASITKKDISINTVAPLTKDYDGTPTATAGAVSFTGEVAGQLLAAGTDYTVSAVFTGGNYDAGGSKPYTYTITMLSTTKAGNYNLTGGNTKAGTDGTINKIAYTGTKTANANVAAGEATTGKTVTLPPLPSGGAAYAATGTAGGATSALIDGTPAVSGTTLTFDTTSQVDGTTATITVAVTSTNYTNYDVTVTVTAQDVLQEDTPAASIDYINERLIGLTAGAAYTVDGAAKTADASGNIAIDSVWFGATVSIVKTGIPGDGTANSDPQSLAIPAQPAAPTGAGKTDTTGGGSNGTITGVDVTMEYKLSSAATWTAVTGTEVTGLAAGTYNVRIKATASVFASAPVSLVIASSSVPTPPGGSYTGGGGAGSTPATATVPAADGTVSVTYTMSGGIATLNLPDSKVAEIISKAKDGKAIFDLSKVTGAIGAALPKAALAKLAGAGLAVEIRLPQGTVAFSAAAAASIAAQANGANVTISLNQVNQSTLTAAQRAAIKPGDLVFNISVMSGTQVITNFDGTITISVPYTGSLPVAVWYLNAAGELEKLDSVYDPVTKTVTFVTNHLSLYIVGLDNDPTPITPVMPVNPFSDVFGTDWFINDVIYAYSKSLIAGTTPTTFAPYSNLKYSEAITLAARMHELYTTGEVTLENDDDLWYQTYVDYAVENGIIASDDEYDWNATATRAGYMQIFAKALPDDALKAINSVPDGSIPDVPMNYPGAAAIYKLYRAGILQGNDDAHTCNPDANIRRSEVAAILTRMMNPEKRIEFSI